MSMENIQKLKEDRAKLTNQLRETLDSISSESRTMTALEDEKIKNMEAEFDKLSDQIQAEERQLARERFAGEKQNEGHRAAAGAGKEDSKDAELIKAFNKVLSHGDVTVYNSLQQTNATQAGYLVAPQQFVAELIKEIDNEFHIRNLARKFTLTKAESLGFPKRTSRMSRAVRGGEIQAPTPDNALKFGKRELFPKFMTAEILVSKPLLRNAAIDPDAIVRKELAYAFAETQEIEFFTGNGANEALGVFTASEQGISTARDVSADNTTTAMTFDGLMNTKFSIKPQYWKNLNWCFHRDGVKQLVKIKDLEGQYIWRESVRSGEPDTLLGFGVQMSEYCPNTFTSGQYVGLLGDFQYYFIADSLNMEIQVLQELYARTNQVDFIARLENDAMPVLEEAFARVKLG